MILVLFASKSDKAVYDRVVKQLRKDNLDFTLRIASAHKSPDLVEKIIKDDYNLIISGAGLAAHLPGFIAAKVLCPVIGIPVDIDFNGLDALFSIMQMPPGIPVLSTGINQAEEAAVNAKKILNKYSKVNIVTDTEKAKPVQKAIDILKQFNINHEISTEFDNNSINLNFMDAKKSDALVITVPWTEKISDLMDLKHGLYVGKERGDNAALAAIQIMDKYLIKKYRKGLLEKIKQTDKEERL